MSLSAVGVRAIEGLVALTTSVVGEVVLVGAWGLTALLVGVGVAQVVQSPDHLLGTGLAGLPMGLLLLLPRDRDARRTGLVLLALAAALFAGAWWTWPAA